MKFIIAQVISFFLGYLLKRKLGDGWLYPKFDKELDSTHGKIRRFLQPYAEIWQSRVRQAREL